MATSDAKASVSLKRWKPAFPPCAIDFGVKTSLRKKFEDATLTFTFNEETLKNPAAVSGATLSAEKPLPGDTKAVFTYDFGKNSAACSLAMKKPIHGSTLHLKATIKDWAKTILLEEQFDIDGRNRVTGSYNFSNEEAIFAYTHSAGQFSYMATYNFMKDMPTLSVTKRQKSATMSASYNPKSEEATLTWSKKPYTMAWKTRIGASSGVAICSIDVSYLHTFDL